MRHFPLAVLVLAIASLVPASLSAHTRHARLSSGPGRVITARDIHTSHLQRAQPSVFRPSAHQGSRPRGRHIAERFEPRQRPARGASTATHSRRSLRQALAVSNRRPQISQPSLHQRGTLVQQPSPRQVAPSQQTAVVNIIRPTDDRPQLPSVQDAVSNPIILPAVYNNRGRLIVPAPLLGSHEILVRQNTLADQDGLGRVQDDADLDGMRAKGMLVPIPATDALRIDDRLPYNRRFCRPWTAQFLANLSRDFYARFHTPLQVNSAVRTVEFQVRLQRINGNAAPAEGDTASPHLTGQAVDIGKRGLTLPQIAWLRGYLLPLIQAGRADVEEEFQQSCFHISIYRRYLPADSLPQRYAVTSRTTSALAAALR